jgi:putative aldouronate transport system permease protein
MNRLLHDIKEYRVYLLMLAPAVVFFVIFSYLPMAGIILAFKEYDFQKGVFGSPWNGLINFRFFFIGGAAWRVTRNTILYNTVFIIFGNCLQLFCAVCLSEMRFMRYRKISQTIMFLPYFISWVLVGGFMYDIFNKDQGMLSNLMTLLGQSRPDVYGNPYIWPVIIVLVQAWKWVGYGTVIYLAAITGINPELYEAGMIDGANIFQLVRHITLPSLIPTIITLVLLNFGQIFRGDFQMFYQLTGTNGILFPTTDVIDTYVVRSLLTQSDYGMSAAAGLYQSVFGLALIVTLNGIIKKVNADYALF